MAHGITFIATSGVDTPTFTNGHADILRFTAANQANIGDTFDGKGGGDAVQIGSGVIIDLRPVSFISFANLRFEGAGSVQLNQSQLAGLSSSFTGVNGSVQTLTVHASGSFNANTSGLAFTTWEATDILQVVSGAGSQTLTGRTGSSNILDGGSGADTMTGSTQNDIYYVDDAGDVVTEGSNAGTDEVRTTLLSYTLGSISNLENLTGLLNSGQTLTGNALSNLISGGAGNDTLNGGGGADTLVGGAGNDTLDGGTGADAMAGGIENDIYIVDDVGDVVTEASGAGIDEVRTALTSYTLAENVENLTGTSNAGQTLIGNSGDNHISAGAGNDTLHGGDGNDFLQGHAGNDIHYGGAGNDIMGALNGSDTMFGGLGDDTYRIDDAADLVVEEEGEGIDTVFSRISYTLTANVENLTLAGTADLAGTGNELANVLRGNAGDNALSGLDGDDTLTGGGGNDQLHGGNGSDTLSGDTGDDVLEGGAGADEMRGGSGNDDYYVDNTGDVVRERAGGGTDAVYTDLASYTLAANVEHLHGTGVNQTLNGNGLDNQISGSSGDEILRGGAGNDALYGGAGNDTLQGGNGDDVLNGGEGRDVLNGGVGADRFEFFTGDSSNTLATADRIVNFSSVEGDQIDLSSWDNGPGDFTFIGTDSFTGTAGELRAVQNANGTSLVTGDVDGDGFADFLIIVGMSTDQAPLSGADFIF